MKKWVLVISAVACFIVCAWLMLPGESRTSNYNEIGKESYKSTKESFRVFMNKILHGDSGEEVDEQDYEVTGTEGIRLANAAIAEYNYYTTSGLKGGFRYWNWYDHLNVLLERGGSISDYEPAKDHMTTGGWYYRAVVEEKDAAWCDMFVSCVAQRAGLLNNKEDSDGTNGMPVAFGCGVMRSFAWYTKQSGAECVFINSSNMYKANAQVNVFSQLQTMGADTTQIKVVDTYNPKPGDIAFYFWKDGKNQSALHHIGIVTDATDTKVTIVAGNEGGASDESIVTMREYDICGSSIAGFVRPAYKTLPQSEYSVGAANGAMSGLLKDSSGVEYFMYTPDTGTNGKPVVFVYHGIQSSTAELDAEELAVYSLAKQGKIKLDAVLVFPRKAYGQWSPKVNAYAAFMKNVVEQYSLNTNRVYFYGFSQGSYSGLEIINACDSGFIKAAVFVDGNPENKLRFRDHQYFGLRGIAIMEAAESRYSGTTENRANGAFSDFAGNFILHDYSGIKSHSWINGFSAATNPGDATRWGNCTEASNILGWVLQQ